MESLSEGGKNDYKKIHCSLRIMGGGFMENPVETHGVGLLMQRPRKLLFGGRIAGDARRVSLHEGVNHP
jgi:hypothetical protein